MKKSTPQILCGIWLLVLAGGMVLLNYPFLQIFNDPAPAFGFPRLVFFVFLVWGVLIALTFFLTGILENGRDEEEEASKPQKKRRL